MLTIEIGMLYMVWRFLVGAKCKDEWKALLKHELAGAGARITHDWTFVHLASAYGDTECLEILLSQPCNQNHQVLTAATELEGFTPLHLAAHKGYHDIVTILVEHADKFPSSNSAGQVEHDVLLSIPRDRVFGRSPLHYASYYSYPKVVSILVEKWGSLGVDLTDCFGITALHLAAAREPKIDKAAAREFQFDKAEVLSQLTKVAKCPDQKVSKDFALQMAAMARLLVERRHYVNSTTSTLFIPCPRLSHGIAWALPGFTVFHYVAVYGTEEHFNILLQQWGETLFWGADDCAGFKPSDYSSYYPRFNNLFKSLQTKNRVDRSQARSKLLEGVPKVDQMWRLVWVNAMDKYLLSGSYSRALDLCNIVHNFVGEIMEPGLEQGPLQQEHSSHVISAQKSFKLDDEVWNHLEWALDKALQQEEEYSSQSVISAVPRLQAWDAEEMLLVLIEKNVFHGKSTKQRCLQWAISKRMARLAEELVKDTECELVSVVPGGKHLTSPLARASKDEVAKKMPGLLATMELREDVKRRWFEDRQVYVDYANTLLVGAVLIAGLAFSGWLQPPRGYVDGIIDMKQRAVRMFVWSSSLSFFLGMGTVVAGATGAMPFAIGAGHLVSARDKVHNSVVLASLLLVSSISCLAISFASAALAILPVSQNLSITSFLAINGLFLCCMLLSFVKRLQGLSSSLHKLFKIFKV